MKNPNQPKNRRNGSTIVIIIILVVVIGGIAYFISDPFQSKVDEAYKGFSQWTPENMAKDPSGYLAWARKEMDSVEISLKAREIELKQLRQKHERENKTAELAKQRYEKVLQELKVIYSDAKANDSWPANTAQGSLSEEELRSLIMDADDRVQGAELKMGRYSKTAQVIERDIGNVAVSLKKIEQQKVALEKQIEQARLSEDLSKFEDLVDSVNTIADANLSMEISDPEKVSLDDFVDVTEKVDEERKARFERIMGE